MSPAQEDGFRDTENWGLAMNEYELAIARYGIVVFRSLKKGPTRDPLKGPVPASTSKTSMA
jgi:hypothetical protein